MDNLTRFSDYDVFAYIGSGLGVLVVWDIVFSTQFILGAEWTVAGSVLTIVAAYIVGQILAAPSGWLIERKFVHHILFRPSIILMESRNLGWRAFLKKTFLQDYYTPMDSGLQRKVRGRAKAEIGSDVTGEALFWCAFPVAKKDSNAYARMDSFLRLYGFCRNIAFVGFAGACFISGSTVLEWMRFGWSSYVVQQFQWALLALLIGFGMLHRYLKFFRLYNLEVFLAYSESTPDGDKSRDEN